MKLIAQVIIAAFLLTGISFAKGPKYKSSRSYYGYDQGWRDRDYRYRSNPYTRYRALPPGIQKRVYRGRALPPGHARRVYRDNSRYRYNGYRYNRPYSNYWYWR